MRDSQKRKFLVGTGLFVAMMGPVLAQEKAYPNRPIRVIVPTMAGGINDVVARLVSKKMSEFLGQPMVVDNRAGGDSIVGTRAVKEAPADGYTVLVTHNGFSSLPAIKLAPGYEPQTDFRGVGPMMMAPFILEVPGEQRYRNLPEFIASAKANPTQLSFASPGIGTPNHIATEMFFRKTGISNLTHVPFRGASAAVIEVAGGRIPFYADAYASSAPHYKSGKIRPLAVTSASRLPLLPDVPTLKELNVDLTYEYWIGMVAPKATPEPVVQRLSDALKFALNDAALQERFRSEGARIPSLTPAQFDVLIDKEVREAGALIKDLGIEKQ